MPTAAKIAVLILSALLAGFDLIIEAVEAVMKKDFFAAPVILFVVVLGSMILGFFTDAAVAVILYQICMAALRYAQARTKSSALELVRGEDADRAARVRELVNSEGAGETELASVIGRSVSIVLKAAIVLAVIYAIVVPFTGATFRSSIRRALMILAVCTPMSVLVAMPLTAIVAQCFSARQGILFNKARNMEDTAHAETAVFDQAGVFSEEAPKLLAVRSDKVDKDTMMDFAAHALYYSEQPVAKAVTDAYDQEYRLDMISDFAEIPGSGVTVKLGGNPVVIASGDYLLSRGVRVPQEQEPGQVYYLVVAGRYVGKIIISASKNEAVRDLTDAMRDVGMRRCVLLTEDGAEQSQKVGEAFRFDEVHGECDLERKLKLISDMVSDAENHVLYVYSNGFEAHSEAKVDMRVSKKAKYADVAIDPERITALPFAVQICKRMGQVQAVNAIFAFLVKAVLIFLAINGKCTLWFALFLDSAAAIATVLNAIRVTKDSLFANLRRSE
jgi:Cd2+/Zn2+-exporting ATPase